MPTTTHLTPSAAPWIVPAAAALAASARLARAEMTSSESRVFRVLNRSVGLAERPVWLVMQLGNGLAAAVVPAALLAAGRSVPEARRVALAAGGGWQLAKVVKQLVARPRPSRLLDDVVLRDGDPSGRGFVSGHSAVAMAAAVAALPLLAPRQRPVALAAAVTVGLARVHVGAHLPLDVVGGLALGALWGAGCAPRPRPRPNSSARSLR